MIYGIIVLVAVIILMLVLRHRVEARPESNMPHGVEEYERRRARASRRSSDDGRG